MTDGAATALLRYRHRATTPAVQAGLVALVVALVAQAAAHRWNLVFAFWDAQAHLDIARRLHDSTTPGLQMLGTVWLPVPHLLLAPLTLVDAWWWNGLAGGIVGLLAFVTATAALHDLLVRHTAGRRIAWLGTLLFMLNPSLLYLQTTAMTEPLLLAFVVLLVALLDRWSESEAPATLRLAGIVAALAVGTRYDGWFAAGGAVLWVGWRARQRGTAWWRPVMRFAWPTVIFLVLWLGYNAWYFGDALAFQRGVWSAQSQQAALALDGRLPAQGHPLLALGTYAGAIALTCGWPLGLVAALALLSRGASVRSRAALLVLLTAIPFNVLALWAGQSVVALPWSEPAGVANLRYGIMALPGLAALVALAGDTLAPRVAMPLLGGLLVAQSLLFVLGWPGRVGALREGLAIRDGDRRQQAASDWLADHYDGGRVLVDEAVNLSPRTRIPMRERIYRWTWETGAKALAAPEQEVDWVVVDQRHDGGAVARALPGRAAFAARFDRVLADSGLEVWRRR